MSTTVNANTVTAVAGERSPARRGHAHVEQVMGMPIGIDVRDDLGADGAAAISAAVAWFHEVDRNWSTWNDASTITRFARGELRAEDLPEEMHAVLDACELLRIDTGGAFDIHVPAPNGTRLEPSGYVKGWSVDGAARLLDAAGARNYCINAGGDVVVRGEAQPGVAWRVGVRHPSDAHALADVLALSGRRAVATSGTYERGAHIVDPRTGAAADAVRSATVVGTDLAIVDVAATTLFVLGTDGFGWVLEQGLEAMVITHDDAVLSTPGYAPLRA